MLSLVLQKSLCFHLYFYSNRSSTNPSCPGVKTNHISKVYRRDEFHRVHGLRHEVLVGLLVGFNSGSLVDIAQYDPSKNGAAGVSVLWHHDDTDCRIVPLL